MGSYDMSLFLKGMVSKDSNIKDIKILCRGAYSYYNVKFNNINFIDSCSFIQASLAQLVDLRCKNVPTENLKDVIPHTVGLVTERFGACMVKYVYRKQIYPYEIAKSSDEMKAITNYPPRAAFRDTLNDKSVIEEDYLFGYEVWNELAKICQMNGDTMNLQVLHEWYLCLDVMLLTDIWVWYCQTIYDDFKTHPANFLTSNSLGWFLARKMSKTNLELISDYQLFTDFEQSLKGGFVTVVQRYCRPNNKEVPNYDENLEDSFLAMVDFNSLYGELMQKSLPYGGLEYVDPSIFTTDYILNGIDTSENAKIGYMLIVDLKIPDHLKYLYDDLPIIMLNSEKIKPSDHTANISTHCSQQKLLAIWHDVNQYSVDCELLQFILTVGCVMTKVHRVIRYLQKPIFAPYIEHCVEKRKQFKHIAILSNLYKLLTNCIFGKSCQNERNFCKMHTLVHLKNLNYHLANPRFHKMRRVSKRCFCISKNKNYIKLTSPIYIGATILQKAKLKSFKFHYLIAKPSGCDFPLKYIIPQEEWLMKLIHFSRKYIKSVSLCYADTDSLTYMIRMSVKNLDFAFLVTELFLSAYLDRSNFKVLPTLLHLNLYKAGALGLYKSELSDDIVVEAIFLTPKCYSIKTIPRNENQATAICDDAPVYKMALKGIPKRAHTKYITHQTFKDVLFSENNFKPPTVTFHQFKFNEKLSTITTVTSTKQPLSLADNKRFYINNMVSYGFGHPLNVNEKIGDIITIKGGVINGTEHMIPSRLQNSELDTTCESICNDNNGVDDNDVINECDDDDDDDEVNTLDILVDLIDGHKPPTYNCDDDDEEDNGTDDDYQTVEPPPMKKRKMCPFAMTQDEQKCFNNMNEDENLVIVNDDCYI